MTNYLTTLTTLQLEKLHSGKVRDSFRVSGTERLIFVSDRISAFDRVLKTPVPMKGAVLNKISNYWFTQTRHIVQNHFIREVDPNISIVREVIPIRVEMVVRGYLSGSMWRYYQQGKRKFSGITVPDGMHKNEKFPTPLVTPTTKEDSDREITPEDIVLEGLATAAHYRMMQETALALYTFGAEQLAAKGIILVDTKYEFGLLDEEVILIDEIHTPDASRFWRTADYETSPATVEQIDKEFVRLWLIANKDGEGNYPESLPQDIIEETTSRYLQIYNLVTDAVLDESITEHISERVVSNLVSANLCLRHSVVLLNDGSLEQGLVNAFLDAKQNNSLYCPIVKNITSMHELDIFLRQCKSAVESLLIVLPGAAAARHFSSVAALRDFPGFVLGDMQFQRLQEEIELFLTD